MFFLQNYELKCLVLTFLNLYSFDKTLLEYDGSENLTEWLIELLEQLVSGDDDKALTEICNCMFCVASFSSHYTNLLICGCVFRSLSRQVFSTHSCMFPFYE
jgi:hypothetical protein